MGIEDNLNEFFYKVEFTPEGRERAYFFFNKIKRDLNKDVTFSFKEKEDYLRKINELIQYYEAGYDNYKKEQKIKLEYQEILNKQSKRASQEVIKGNFHLPNIKDLEDICLN